MESSGGFGQHQSPCFLQTTKWIYMKKCSSILTTTILILLICVFAYGAFQGAVITGTVRPAEAATDVWAISGKDTFSGSIVENTFEISKLKPGTYAVVIEAEPPYKKAVRENIQAIDGQVTKIGEIVLEK
jgi:hypothetical protein